MAEKKLAPDVEPVKSKVSEDTAEAAKARYFKTGQHLGKFDTPDNPDAYARALHNLQDVKLRFGR